MLGDVPLTIKTSPPGAPGTHVQDLSGLDPHIQCLSWAVNLRSWTPKIWIQKAVIKIASGYHSIHFFWILLWILWIHSPRSNLDTKKILIKPQWIHPKTHHERIINSPWTHHQPLWNSMKLMDPDNTDLLVCSWMTRSTCHLYPFGGCLKWGYPQSSSTFMGFSILN